LPAYEIHSLYVQNALGQPSEIKLSKKYFTTLIDGHIRVERNPEYGALPVDKRVASFTTLFGMNGTGKTTRLFELCQTCSSKAGGQPLGMLFSVDKRLTLFRGRSLSGWKIEPGGQELDVSKSAPSFETVFYSTSPFEHGRRFELKRMGVHDVSPTFGSRHRFDGLGLIMNYAFLPGSAAEASKDREFQVRGWVSRQRLPIEWVDELLDRYGYQGEDSLKKFARKTFGRWLKSIPNFEHDVLLANLKIITEIEGNGSVAGRFVGELLGTASREREKPDTGQEEGWRELLELSTRVIDESGFIPANGFTLLKFLGALRHALEERQAGTRFTVNKTPAFIKAALDRIEPEFPSIANFAADLGFLDFKLQNISSGQFAFLYLYAALGSALARLSASEDRTPVFVMIDEGEMFFHLAWQREYVEGLHAFIEEFATLKRPVHIVIATHSLIVAADSPPHSLFDVQKGAEANGFGFGPRATLDDVYGVHTFAGTFTEKMIDQLTGFLKNPNRKATPKVRALANALAEPQLKEYVMRAIQARG
jgi:hypothetical protein